MRKITILLAFLLFAVSQGAFAQKTITGKVTSSEDGLGMAGVPVVVKGTTVGTATDVNGAFTLSVPNDAATLVVSFIGMNTVELPIGTQTVFNVEMTPNITALDDVVVTAFGISRQAKALTYATQNVNAASLAEARSINVVNSLSGKVAGLSITTAGSGVGAASKVLLRGNRSIAGSSEPLYVIDGIPMGGISNLSPDDIASISIMKGANAAALYGSRANNGAIIVSTKSGAGNAEGVLVDLGFTFQGTSATILDKQQNEFGQGANGIYSPGAILSWGEKMTGQQVAHWTPDINDPNYGTQYAYEAQPDNFKDYFQQGLELATNLQIVMNTKSSNTAFSYTNTQARGIVESNNLHSNNFNLRFGTTFKEKLTLDTKVTFIKQEFENVFSTGEDFNNPMRYLYVLPRSIRSADIQKFEYVNPGGQTRQHYWRWNDNGTGNAYWTRNRVLQPRNNWRTVAMMSLKYEIAKGLSLMGRSAIDYSSQDNELKYYNDTYTMAINGGYTKSNSSSYGWNSDVLLNYKKTLGDIAIDVNAGANNYYAKSQGITGSGVVFNVENLFVLTNTANPRPSESFSEKVVNSVYGFAEVGWKNAVFLNLTGRNDWSSTLPEANRSYFYPSVGLTAVVSDLITMPEFLTYFKLRGSYAIVGNDTSPYQLFRTANVGTGGVVSLSNVLPNADLKPETTKSLETGFDLRFMQDRIRLGFTWYQTNTYDQLFATPVPSTSGVASIFQNGADVQNRGTEITLGAAIVAGKDFSWDLDLNWAKNTSEVLKIAEGFDVLRTGGSGFIYDYKLVAGQPYGEIYGKGWQRGPNNEVIVNAVNGIPLITPGFSVRCANFNPDWLGGITNTFGYKNWNLSFLIDFRQGGSFVAQGEAISAGSGIQEYTAVGRDGSLLVGSNVLAGEVGVNKITDAGGNVTYVPNTKTTSAELFWNNVGGRNNPTAEAFVRDASNIRMREVVLGYDLPKEIVNKTFFRSARIALVGRNLFFLQNKAEYVDPEVMLNTNNNVEGINAFPLPTSRTYGFSLNFGF